MFAAGNEERRAVPDRPDTAIRQMALRIKLVLLTRRTVLYASVWLFLAGTAALAIRITVEVDTGSLAMLLLGPLVAILPLSFLIERGKGPSLSAIRALCDAYNDYGGILMARNETRMDAAWLQKLPGLKAPRLSWTWRRPMLILMSAAVFSSLAFLCPIPAPMINPGRPLEIKNSIEELNAKLEQLEEQAVIESNKVVEIREELERLQDESTGDDPAKAWEALDHVETAVAEAANEAIEKSLAESQGIAKAQSLVEAALDLQIDDPNGKELEDIMKELCTLGPEMESLLAGELPQELLDAAASGQLSPEQLEALAEFLKECGAGSRSNLVKLASMKWIQGKFNLQQGMCSGSGTNGLGLMALLVLAGDDPDAGGIPGRGGITRGRGDAQMTWQDETSEQGTKFKEQALASSPSLNLKDSIRIGMSRGTPTANAQKESVAAPGSLGTGKADGTSRSQVILPRHRSSVRKFFSRTETKEG